MPGVVPMLDWTFRAMGSEWRIHHGGGVSGADAQVIADHVATDERLWSRFLALSDVARISQGAGAPVRVDPSTVALVQAARDWSSKTDGVFNPLLGTELSSWGYRQGVGDAAPTAAPTSSVELHDVAAIICDVEHNTVAIPIGLTLDLGGIGKSWAAVRAGAELARLVEDDRLIIDAGGDLTIVRGTHRIESAAGPITAVAGSGVATSSSERRAWALGDGTAAHHLIDPCTGQPGTRGTAIVAGVDPVAADVLASCVVLRPSLIATLEVPAAHVALDGTVTVSVAWEGVKA